MKLSGSISTANSQNRTGQSSEPNAVKLARNERGSFSRQSRVRQDSPGSPTFGLKEPVDLENGKLRRWLKRSRDGSLWSVRIPVTRANRRLLRAVRLAELAAWEAADHACN